MKRNNRQSLFDILTNPLFILLSILILLLLTSLHYPMSNDEGMWSYIGRIWTWNRIPPYIGAMENKTPGIMELFAISNILFGVNYIFVRVLGIIAVLLTSMIIYLIGKKLSGHLAGIFSMLIFGFTMIWGFLDGQFPSQVETFMVLFSSLAIYIIIIGVENQKWKRWILLAGFMIGLAITFKQIAIFSFLGIAAFFIVYSAGRLTLKKRAAGLIILALGIMVSTFIFLIPLFASGVSIKDYIEGAWLILRHEGSRAPTTGFHVRNFFNTWGNTRLVVFYPFFALFLFLPGFIKNRYVIGLLLWLLFDFIGVNASGYYYGHQIRQIVPSLSLIAGILTGNVLLKNINDEALLQKYASGLIIFIIIMLLPLQSLFLEIPQSLMRKSNYTEIGRWLKNNSKKDDYIYVGGIDGNPILAYSERVSPSKYFNYVFLRSDKDREILLNDLNAKKPLYFLKSKNPFEVGDKLDGFLKNNFTFNCSKGNFDIYKRNAETEIIRAKSD
ncbi:MAG: glycosyltransferase family 39 protein [Ignavibacteriaceae bacterium]|nr:glycosyltransferase family 39 protein [Ignavibacteriaceae bacterium]